MFSCAILLIPVCSVFAQDDDTFDAFFEEFAKRRDAVKTFQASFTQRSITEDEELISTGTVIYSNPRRLIFRYTEPDQVYMLDGERAYEYDAELEQLQIFDLEDSPQAEAFYLGFENNLDRLREGFDLRLLVDEVSGGYAIELRPKPDDDETFFQRVTLHLRAGDSLPREIHIINDEESEVYISLSDAVVNGDVDPDALRIFLPEGTDIIENDEYIERVGPEGKRVPETLSEPAPETP